MVVAELLDASELVGLPEHCEEVLHPPPEYPARCLAFNPAGTLLATGCVGGAILIWDYQTRGLIRTWATGFSASVLSLLWISGGHQLLAGDEDGRLLLWDVVAGKVERARDPASIGITSIQAGTCADDIFLSFARGPAARLSLKALSAGPLEFLTFPGGLSATNDDQAETVTVPLEKPGENGTRPNGPQAVAPSESSQVVAVCREQGLILASVRAGILVLRAADLAIVDAIRLPVALRVHRLVLSSSGDRVIVLMKDRLVRVYAIEGLSSGEALMGMTPRDPGEVAMLLVQRSRKAAGSVFAKDQRALLRLTRKFEQQVERRTWGSAAFTGDGEFVLAAVSGKDECAIYVWNAQYGHMDRVLEGLRDCGGVQDMVWHPKLYPMQLLTLMGTGSILIWAKALSDRWTAFAPDFRELEENEVYVEREDEFDLNPEVNTSGGAECGADDDVAALDEPIEIRAMEPPASPAPPAAASANKATAAAAPLVALPVIIQPEARQGPTQDAPRQPVPA